MNEYNNENEFAKETKVDVGKTVDTGVNAYKTTKGLVKGGKMLAQKATEVLGKKAIVAILPILIPIILILFIVIAIALLILLNPFSVTNDYVADGLLQSKYTYSAPQTTVQAAAENGIDLKIIESNTEELKLFTQVVLAEASAGTGHTEDMTAVAEVILNRVVSPDYPNTVTEVIQAEGQFEAYGNGSYLSHNPTNADYELIIGVIEGKNVVLGNADIVHFCNPMLVNAEYDAHTQKNPQYITDDGWYIDNGWDRTGTLAYLRYIDVGSTAYFFSGTSVKDAITGRFVEQKEICKTFLEEAYEQAKKDVKAYARGNSKDIEYTLNTFPSFEDVYGNINYGYMLGVINLVMDGTETEDEALNKIKLVLYGLNDTNGTRYRNMYNILYTEETFTENVAGVDIEHNYYRVNVYSFSKENIFNLINRTWDGICDDNGITTLTYNEYVMAQIEAMKSYNLTHLLGLNNTVVATYNLQSDGLPVNLDDYTLTVDETLPMISGNVEVPYFAQADYSEYYLGSSQTTISKAGCTLTALSMAATYYNFARLGTYYYEDKYWYITSRNTSYALGNELSYDGQVMFIGNTPESGDSDYLYPNIINDKFSYNFAGDTASMHVQKMINSLAASYGFTCFYALQYKTTDTMEIINDELSQGHIVLVAVKPHSLYGASPNSSHWYLLTGINIENKTYYVADPNREHQNAANGQYPIEDVIAITERFASFGTGSGVMIEADEETLQYYIHSENVNIVIDGLTREYKIAWVSDLHLQADDGTGEIKSGTSEWTSYNSRKSSKDLTTSDGWESEDILPEIIKFLNSESFDAIIFGGDILDYCSQQNVAYLNKYLSQLTISQDKIMYLRADHDYGTDLYPTSLASTNTSTLQSAILDGENYTKRIDFGEFIIDGINLSTSQINQDNYDMINADYNSGKPLIIATHVPWGSNVDTSLKDLSLATRGQEYYWGGRWVASSQAMNNLQDIVFNNTKGTVKYVLAGHMHANSGGMGWDGYISDSTKEHIFVPAYAGYVGVIKVHG